MEPNRAYQAEMIAQCQQHLNSVGKVVLAAGCGAGKTRMATEMLVEFLRANPDKKVLFLAHATRSLRKQVATVLAGDKRFTSAEVTPNVKSAELEDAAVHIAIPQSGAIREQRYGMIVVDEAHQYYFGDMITGIIASNPEAKQLLLTASHWRFTLTGSHPVVTRSQLELLDDGVISDIETRMMPTSQEFRKFSAAGDLAESEELGNVKQLVTFVKKWARGFTLVACHSQKAARDVCKALGSQAIISTCEDDPNDRSIEEFRKAGSIKYLVVVFRGVLGLDMPELETVMDLTATKNVDRVYQLMGRVVRLCEGKQPLYVKMAPKIQLEYYQHVMSGTLHLAHPEYYRKWNGKLDSLWLTVHKSNAKPSKVRHGSRPLPKFESLLPRWSELRPLLEKMKNKEDEEFYMAKLSSILGKLNRWTYESCIADALCFSNIKEWRIASPSYGTAHANGWYEDCVAHMPPTQRGKWTLQACKVAAAKYSTRKAWALAKCGYAMAAKNGWLDECCAHMGPNKTSTKPIVHNGMVFLNARYAAKHLLITEQSCRRKVRLKQDSFRKATDKEAALLGNNEWVQIPKA